mmetsp:Transcript_47793/g.88645  ORF Transcript_47793/g.88645 Transcript_47793/m.88645 type:complete len:318 (-) Transcript_47793:121-1074(-)
MREAWESVRDAKYPSYANVVIKEANLPCALDEFYDFFLSDSSLHSVADFQGITQSDIDIKTSPWSLSEQDAFSFFRTIRYIHPMNSSMAPPSATVTKKQRYRRFGDEGLILETRTFVKGIPKADCFYVDDRLAVESCPEGGGVNATASFEVRFVKRTVFKKRIQGTSDRVVTEALVEYEKYVRRAIEEEREKEDAMERKKAAAEEAEGVGVKVEVKATATGVSAAVFIGIALGIGILAVALVVIFWRRRYGRRRRQRLGYRLVRGKNEMLDTGFVEESTYDDDDDDVVDGSLRQKLPMDLPQEEEGTVELPERLTMD